MMSACWLCFNGSGKRKLSYSLVAVGYLTRLSHDLKNKRLDP